MLEPALQQAIDALPQTARIVVLTGAGISRESGLDTFRDAGGIWQQVKLEEVATPEAFQRDPAKVLGFYNARRATLKQGHVQPNPAHHALAELEQHWQGDLVLVTQNVDNLHERAGSDRLVHMHGQLDQVFCQFCDGVQYDWLEDLSVDHACPRCGKTGGMRPDIVWFGEMPYQMDYIESALGSCDLFFSIGTSAQVWPAAGFVAQADAAQALTIELNLETTEMSRHFQYRLSGLAGETVPALVAALLGRQTT